MLKFKEKLNKIWLEKFDCFSISGKDTKKFLNGITTGNIINFNNQFLKTCWLTPNGVLKSLLEINNLNEKFNVLILAGDINEIKKYFNEIIFPFDDVLLSDSFSIYRFQEVDEIISWRRKQPIFFKSKNEAFNFPLINSNVLNSEDLKIWKIKQAIPILGNEINGKNNPLELGLTDLIDFNKGCYLGQETISKIRNVSSLKQEIRVWRSKGSLINNDLDNKKIYNNSMKEEVVGNITSFYEVDDQKKIGLAMIKRKYLEENYFYSENFGNLKIEKSISSIFF